MISMLEVDEETLLRWAKNLSKIGDKIREEEQAKTEQDEINIEDAAQMMYIASQMMSERARILAGKPSLVLN